MVRGEHILRLSLPRELFISSLVGRARATRCYWWSLDILLQNRVHISPDPVDAQHYNYGIQVQRGRWEQVEAQGRVRMSSWLEAEDPARRKAKGRQEVALMEVSRASCARVSANRDNLHLLSNARLEKIIQPTNSLPPKSP